LLFRSYIVNSAQLPQIFALYIYAMCTAPPQPRLMRNYACGIGFDDDVSVRQAVPVIVDIIVEEEPVPDAENNDINPTTSDDISLTDTKDGFSEDEKVAVIRDDKVSYDSGSSIYTVNNRTCTKATNSRGRAGPHCVF